MADVQKQIEQYDEAIRLKRFDENATLRQKRDTVLEKLRTELAAQRKKGKDVPSFRWFNQGSYQMGTGIEPETGDYDIDVGLDFNATTADYPDPVALKELVHGALEGHTLLGTSVRRSCVTVKYQVQGEQAYHVDLAVYACENVDASPHVLYLAKGKLNSKPEHRTWERSDPEALTTWVGDRFADAEHQQFLRVIRCLKGWKSHCFSHEGNCAPPGIGLTVAAGLYFTPAVDVDRVSKKVTSDDRKAMRALVDSMIARFAAVWSSEKPGTVVERLRVDLPVTPHADVMSKMTDAQMKALKDNLIALRDVLDAVASERDPVVACQKMVAQFGARFPVPTKEETGQSRGPAIISSGTAA